MSTFVSVHMTLHSGLHKCASTFIQYQWWAAFGEAKETWYPTPQLIPPGQVEFARSLCSSVFDAADTVTAWTELVPHVQRLLVSAEDCTRANAAYREASLSRVLQQRGVQLDTHIMVMRPPSARFPKMWAQLILAGNSGSQQDIFDEVVMESCLLPGRLPQYLESIGVEQSVVHLLGPGRSPNIGSDLLEAAGLASQARRVREVDMQNPDAENRGRTRLEIELVAKLNQLTGWTGLGGSEVPALLDALDHSELWRRSSAKDSVTLDESVASRVKALAELEQEWLVRAAGAGDIRLCGDLQLLDDWATT